MATGSWDPQRGTAAPRAEVDSRWLRRFIDGAESDRLDQLPALIGEAERRTLAPWMQADHADWVRAAQSFSEDELIALIRFLTVAEMQIPGWRCDEKSPAIAIASVLKQRGRRLDHELLRWIRAHSDNRYIPYGPAL